MRELKVQFANALLVVLTLAAAVAAFINFQQNFDAEKRFRLPEDGATWVDRKLPDGRKVVQALAVDRHGPAERAGIKVGDRLLKIQGSPIDEAIDVIQVLLAVKSHLRAQYSLERRGVEFSANVIVGERTPDFSLFYQYLIGLAYLGIGLFVYFRRGNAPKALHFLVLCMVSFVLSTFHYTGKLNNFDKVMYWGNVAAGIFAPTIFLHFCLTFPEPRGWMRKTRPHCFDISSRASACSGDHCRDCRREPARRHQPGGTALAARSRCWLAFFSRHVFAWWRSCSTRVPASRGSDRPPATQVAAKRNVLGDCPVHASVRAAVHVGTPPDTVHDAGR